MASETVGAVKIMSYLEKKGKLKVVTTWKKYWFVLEGRLLLYYRSQEEYDNLSPCKGSINMGLATNIRPGLATAGVFQIITRTNTITLRAKERAIQEKWLQALLDASGQQTASNPIKMSHFRYSMDDLIPTGAKHQHQRSSLTRQNTLPHRFKNSKVDRNNSIIHRIRSIGGQTYGGSLDTINKLSKTKTIQHSPKEQKQLRKMSEKSLTETDSEAEQEVNQKNDLYSGFTNQQNDLYSGIVDQNNELYGGIVNQQNDLYSGIVIENAQYISVNEGENLKNDVDHNKNCYIIENDQYMKSDDVASLKIEEYSSTPSENSRPDDVEYYCTYEDINTIKTLKDYQNKENDIYIEPFLPPRREDRKSESDDCACGKEDKKESKFARFTRRFKSIKENDNGFKKKSANFIMKLKGKKKSSSSSDEPISEPIYDTVDYYEINRIKMEQQKPASDNLVKTLIDLQQTLEAKKSKLKEILDSQSNHTSSKSSETDIIAEEKKEETLSHIEGRNSVISNTLSTQSDQEQSCNPPGLPPRRGSKSRSRSPFHDVPKNNSPIRLTNPEQLPEINTSKHDYSIDKILNDLELESKKLDTAQSEELSVRQLIQKFNQVGNEENSLASSSETDFDVSLRQKSEGVNNDAADLNAILMNRHSDELYKLLEELTKVTCAPLLTPGVTSSLVQMKSQPLTDEEWLAIAPIRRRRHSEPDYDVPRSHRSLHILPRSPDKEDIEGDTVIPATRFFGPVLHPNIVSEKSFIDPSLSWRSMTPDSLEPLQLLHAALKKQQRLELNTISDVDRDRSVSYVKTSEVMLELTNGNKNDKILQDDTIEEIATNELETELKNVSKCLANISIDLKQTDNYLDSLEPFNEGATAF